MTCRECERLLLDSNTSPGSKNSASLDSLDLAQSHLQVCPSCSSEVSVVRKLNSALDQFRIATEPFSPSTTAEFRLLAAFRRQAEKSAPVPLARRPWTISMAATGALLAIIFGLLYFSPLRSRTHDIGIQHAAAGKSTADHKAGEPRIASTPLRTEHRSGALNQAAAAISSKHGHSGPSGELQAHSRSILPNRSAPKIQDDDSTQVTEGNVVRITLPSSALAALGIPVHPDLTGGRVVADVMMDSFGVVRSIRLVGSESKAE
jgi:hypothetical protein